MSKLTSYFLGGLNGAKIVCVCGGVVGVAGKWMKGKNV